MKKLLLGCWLAALIGSTAGANLSRISVAGNHFVTADGKPIVFHGLDASDPDKLQRNGVWDTNYFAAIKSWGANIVRLPVHPAAWHLRGQPGYLKLLDEGIAMAKAQGLYVIIDWHSIGNLHEGKFQPGASELYPVALYDTTPAETLDFWQTMAQRYGDDPTVAFFELFNEPALGGSLGQCSWDDWKDTLEQIIATIRAHGCQTVPLVAGFDYGYDLKPVAQKPISAEGIGYVAHPYPGKVKAPADWLEGWTKNWGYVAGKYPVILTEIGYQLPDEPDGYNPIVGDQRYGEAITRYCAQRGISYTVWCFDIHWTPKLIKDWKFTPTPAGEFFKKAMQSSAPNL